MCTLHKTRWGKCTLCIYTASKISDKSKKCHFFDLLPIIFGLFEGDKNDEILIIIFVREQKSSCEYLYEFLDREALGACRKTEKRTRLRDVCQAIAFL